MSYVNIFRRASNDLVFDFFGENNENRAKCEKRGYRVRSHRTRGAVAL